MFDHGAGSAGGLCGERVAPQRACEGLEIIQRLGQIHSGCLSDISDSIMRQRRFQQTL